MSRDDFDKRTKLALAERVAYRCSFPGCGAVTIGPSDEANSSASATGMACHIAAASGGPGARRVRPDMSPEERRSISNGIWMCYTHGKLIDTDERRFTIEMLRKWRELAEERARFHQAHGKSTGVGHQDYFHIGLAESEALVGVNSSPDSIIGDAIKYSCVPDIWGAAVAHRIRDFAIEFAMNAFQHGGATTFQIKIAPTYIRLTDDGARFDVWALNEQMPTPTGGRLAFMAILDSLNDRIVVVSQRKEDRNEVLISRIAEAHELEDLTPCVASVDWTDIRENRHQIVVDKSCQLVYVILPPYSTPSQSCLLVQEVKKESHDPSRFIFVVEEVSDTSLQILRQAFPESRIVTL